MRDMTFTEAVIREAWRVAPIVPFTGRRSKAVVKLGPYELPAEQPTW
jgi:cytochrome P450